MRKIVLTFLAFILLLMPVKQVRADNVAGNSATIAYNFANSTNQDFYFKKRLAIKKVLQRYKSPLISDVDAFMQACLDYRLDCYLLPSIAGHESFFGHYIYPNSYNVFGWGGGYIIFRDFAQGIMTVARGLRQNYLNRGATTIYKIGPIYAQSQSWAVKVTWLRDQFLRQEQENELYFSAKKVQL